jgi:two-component system, response regulator
MSSNSDRNQEILLVEDNEDDIFLTKRAFSKAGLKNEIVVARDGEEAISYLFGAHNEHLNDPCPALILLDINLPKIDGLEILKRLRSEPRTRLCRVVILTSSNEDSNILKGYNLGATAYIRKPVDFKQFANVVSQVGLFWLVLNEPPPNPCNR